MKNSRVATAPSWRRSALFLALLALTLPLIWGCSDEISRPEEPQFQLRFTQADGAVPMNLAPDFCPNLPDYPVVVGHTAPGATSLFDIWFWGIEAGFDIATNDVLAGWCVEGYPDLPNVQDPGQVGLYCSYDDALPGNLSSLPIDELNYLLNHRSGTWQEVQSAMWLILGQPGSIPPTPNAQAMADAAVANGGDFVPGPGDLIAIFLYSGDGGIDPNQGYQETIVELRLPPGDDNGGSEACTPGYWRTHFDRWPEPYSPSGDFDTTFGTDWFEEDITLGQAIWARGGGLDKLARHGTAALLNAAHGGVDYPYPLAEVIAMVQRGEADALADANDELDCPLGGTPADPSAYLDSTD